jgi:hypothetical protein
MISRTLMVYVVDADSVGGAITATITSYLLTRDIHQLEELEAESSLAGELERLAALQASGALTDDEFAAAKGRILVVDSRVVGKS